MSGKPIAFLGAFHVCPATNGNVPHMGGVIVTASPNVFVGGMPVARQGDKLVCAGPPDTITGGSTGVFVNGKRIALQGDKTAHGGYIAVGNPTATAGDAGSFSMISPTVEHGSWNPVMKAAPPKHKMACGGRDSSTLCDVFKDPETEHFGQEEWRKPVVKDGVVQPLEGTSGKPKKIKSPKEAGQVATREFMGETYKINKDEQGFPEFTVFETYLSDEHINSGDDDAHFRATNQRLGELLKENPSLQQALGLTEKQYQYFTAQPPKIGTPKGVTWHHHQDVGKMQLVHEGIHGRFGHVGGMEIWGGSRA